MTLETLEELIIAEILALRTDLYYDLHTQDYELYL